jgi:transketolase
MKGEITMEIRELQKISVRIRRHIIKMLAEAGSGHPGGSLSAADIVTVLFFQEMRIDPKRPQWKDRDRFVLSKGHAAPVLYAALALRGFFPEEELLTLRKLGSRLQGHPDMKKLPGVEMSTGSLGQGISASCGMALALKLDGSDSRVYTLIGDGEMEEGLVWETAMAAAHYRLDNLTVILDYNGLQIDGPCNEVMDLGDVEGKWKAFGWNVISIDGHNYEEIISALQAAKGYKGKPTIIVAKTIKGKGVSFMENQVGWHGSAPDREQEQKALAELAQEE